MDEKRKEGVGFDLRTAFLFILIQLPLEGHQFPDIGDMTLSL
jgi:hypothetical protein